MTDPFSVLGVAPSATADEVRAAYRARSMLLHPDLHQGRPEHVRREAERAMTQLTEAYEAALAQRARGGGAASGRAGGATAAKEPLAHRLGRMAARSRTARDASVAGAQAGPFAYRLGWLVGRRRSK